MSNLEGKLTVFFEEPFWVGAFERTENGKLSVSKVMFGAEPKDCEVYEFILKHYNDLKFGPEVESEKKKSKANPKRMRRGIKKEMSKEGVGTKSQQALKLMYEESKSERQNKSREERESEAKRLYELKRQKKKEKHKGR